MADDQFHLFGVDDPLPCSVCGAAGAEFRCDFIVGVVTDVRVLDRDYWPVRCSAPICDPCRVIAGSVMLCVHGRGKGCGCHPESIDHCPGHARVARAIGSGKNRMTLREALARPYVDEVLHDALALQ